jgi:predicted anti-sigma-YlaC factor YlaD
MKRWPINHLTAEDLDAFHSASLPAELREHLAECEECRTMAELDRMVLEELAALPSYSPRDGFADRVLAGVRHARPAHLRRYLPSAVGTWGRLAAAALVVVSLGASIVWTLFNRELVLSWIHLSTAEPGRLLWLGVRVAATNLIAQPWYVSFREFLASPGRLAVLVGGSLVAYGAALVALRRLLTPPSRPAPHALG